MIIWLASYPKSGNTLLRSMLSSYYFSKDGKFEFNLLKKIHQFPNISLFKNLNINTDDELEVVKNYIKVQQIINKQDGNKLRFLKTHSTLNDINGYKFTDLNNSLGVIYIVRDPRNIIRSFANHSQITLEEAKQNLLNVKILGGKNDPLNKSVVHMGSWSSNFKSWKEFKKVKKYLLIKFEDLISQPEKVFRLILNFVHELTKTQLDIDDIKLKNTIKTTSFEYLRDLEEKENFSESATQSQKKYVKFFKYGDKENLINSLPTQINKELEDQLSEEMIELGYLKS